MTKKFKYQILGRFIKDLSSETPDVETYLFVRDNISSYQLGINITSKAIKHKLIEINKMVRYESEPKSFTDTFYTYEINSPIISKYSRSPNNTSSIPTYTLEQAQGLMKDLRVGSQTFTVSSNNATIQMYVDESGNLTDWTNTPHVLELDIPADTDTKFFRFRMD